MSAWVIAACSALPPVPGLPSPSRHALVAPPRSLTRFSQQTRNWGDCSQGFQCSTLTVPLDYQRPRSVTIGIAVVRKTAGDPSRRLGSLVISPGGPGASGADFALSAGQVFDGSLLAQYDM